MDKFYEDFMKKRKLEMQLEMQFDDYYSKYGLVTFQPEIPYSKAMELGRKQDELLLKMCEGKDVAELDLEEVMKQVRALKTS